MRMRYQLGAVALGLTAWAAIAAEKPPSPAPHAGPAHAAADHAPSKSDAGHHEVEGVAPDEALKRLANGNARFVAGTPARPNQNQSRLCDTFANGQHPFAAVLSCADSRVPPELIFDTGIGDLFVVRIAGNVSDVDEVGSLEYAVEHLGVNLVIVMGHVKCGAVTAVVDKAHVTPNIEKLVDNIAPAADTARKNFPQLSGALLVEKAIRANVRQSVADLSARSDLLKGRFASGKLKAVGCVYDLHTGNVDWLEPGDTPPAKVDPHAKPADPHAKPAADSHGKPADPHAGPKAEAHGHGAVPVAAPGDAAKPARETNYLALGGFLGGGALLSYGLIHFLYSRRG